MKTWTLASLRDYTALQQPHYKDHTALRLIYAYNQAAATLNLLSAFAQGGFADLHKVYHWNQDFIRQNPLGERYEDMACQVDQSLGFMEACVILIRCHNCGKLASYTPLIKLCC